MSYRAASVPMYRAIYEELERRIREGEYAPGDRLPSEKELAQLYSVSRITSRKSLSMLSETGLADRLPGKGSFVKSPRSIGTKEGREGGPNIANTIGLVMAGFADSFGVDVLKGVLDQSREFGYSVLLARSDDQADEEEREILRMLDRGAAGLIVDPAHGEFYNNVLLNLVSKDFPLVFVDRHLEGLKAPFVGTDNLQAAFELTDYLFALGHESLGFVSFNPRGTSAIEERLAGFVKAHDIRGISADPSRRETDLNCNIGGRDRQEHVKRDLERVGEFLERNSSMTAVVADELEAAFLVKRAAEERGISIPGDLSLVTFDSIAYPVEAPFITHMKQKEYAMGRRSVEILKDRMEGKGEIVKEYLGADLVPGGSSRKL